NEEYQWYEDMTALIPADPSSATSSTYTPTTAPSADGSFFVRTRSSVTNCLSDTVEIPFTVSSAPVISVVGSNPTVDGASDGSITISGLTASSTYTLEYQLNNGAINSIPGQVADGSGNIIISSLSAGVYRNIRVIDGSCPSNKRVIALFNPSDQGVDEDNISPFRNTVVIQGGYNSGYFQFNSDETACTGSSDIFDSYPSPGSSATDGIAVGIIRDPKPVPPNTPTDVELNGWVSFNLNNSVPVNAVIEKVEYRPVAASTYGNNVCEVPLISASGDIQFDVNQVFDENYGDYLIFSEDAFDDIGNEKYNDFIIAAEEEGTWTDLGAQGAIDVQNRVDGDGIFQVGISLSFGDFNIVVFQFHGMIFAPAEDHELRITYHQLDYGDLPEPKFATDQSGGLLGPSHRIDSIDIDTDPMVTNLQPNMYLGAVPPDAEPIAYPNTIAEGDDNQGTDDEDLTTDIFVNANTNNELWAGDIISMAIPAVNNYNQDANVIVFIDWNDDGVFDNTTERYSETIAASTSSTVNFDNILIPDDVGNVTVGVRIRITSGDVFDAYGPAPDGEVEDLFVAVYAFDYGDLPDSDPATTGSDNYQTVFSRDGTTGVGPRHQVNENLTIGAVVDPEGNGSPQVNGLGDDLDGIDDEDGVFPPDTIIRGTTATFQVFVRNQTSSTAYLQGFVDWNDDGDFEDGFANQKSGPISIAANQSGLYPVAFAVPNDNNVLPGRVAYRFRLSDENTLVQTSTGPLGATTILGEVEDGYVSITGVDWGDLPEPLYATDGNGVTSGAHHQIRTITDPTDGVVPRIWIGATRPEADDDGQPATNADGDDMDGFDDEDLSPSNFTNTLTNNVLIAGDTINFRIPVVNYTTTTGILVVFIDWDEDGIFENVSERYDLPVLDTDTEKIFNITVPTYAKTGEKGVRVRISTQAISDAYGSAYDGEVEDFLVEVKAYDYGDLPDAEDADASGVTAEGNYETIYTRDGLRGPRHLIVEGLSIGTLVDAEGNGQPQLNAVGDDIADIDDEDGIIPPDTIYRGVPAVFQVFVTNTTSETAYLQGFVDWDDNGSLEEPNNKATPLSINSMASGWYDVTFMVPQEPNPLPERVAARFRLTTTSNTLVLSSTGPSDANDINGEVEDLWVPIVGYDWGDLPEPLYATDASGGLVGPSHRVVAVSVGADT
ncbi:MAG: hypothetical protein HRU40_19630, partial [Saprospiraceae bacterium]|nr:hypothetical protein [Saprospiraceae bacterium]